MNKPVFGELFLDRADGRNAIHLFTATPSPLEEKNLGKVFALIEFEQAEAATETIVQTIDEVFTDAYYRSTDFEVEAAFERALHKVNSAIHDLINQYGEAWTYRCNGLLGVIHDSTAYFSTTGKIEGYLVQGETIIDIVQRSQSAEVQPLKLFNSLVSGKCPDRGGLLFATSNLLDYMSLEKLRRTVKDHTAMDSVDYLTSTMSEADTLSNIAAFVVKFEPATATANAEIEVMDRAVSNSTTVGDAIDRMEFTEAPDSMSQLVDKERTTGDLLAPSIWPTIKKRLQYVGNQSAGKTEQRRAVTENYVRSQNKAGDVGKTIGRVLFNVGQQLLLALAWLGKATIRLFQAIFNRRDSISSSLSGSVSGAKGFWKRLSTPQKIFMSLLAATVVVLVISVFTKDRSTKRAEDNEQYASSLQQVDNLLGEVESKQIMNDETGARSSLAQAQTTLDTIPEDSKAYETSGAALQTRIDQLDGTVNKVTVLDQPTQAGDLTSAMGSAQAGSVSLIGKNAFIFAAGSAGVWRLNFDKQEVSTVISDDSSVSGYRTLENDSTATSLAVVNNAEFLQFNPVLEKTSSVEVGLKDNDIVVKDIDVFGDRLYVLAPQQNRIVRLEKDGSSYGSSESWLSNGQDVSKAVSFDIDGSIYVLFEDGAIHKYDGGDKSDFEVPEFSPSLAGSTKLLKNDPEDPFIILNPTQQRVVVLDKNAKLQAQYKSAAFANAKDVAYDADTKTIYVVSDNKVYSIGL
jgi:hypothetical protein